MTYAEAKTILNNCRMPMTTEQEAQVRMALAVVQAACFVVPAQGFGLMGGATPFHVAVGDKAAPATGEVAGEVARSGAWKWGVAGMGAAGALIYWRESCTEFLVAGVHSFLSWLF